MRHLPLSVCSFLWKERTNRSHSLVSHCTGYGIPSPQTGRFPLGHIPPGADDRRGRNLRPTVSQRADPASAIPHGIPLRDEGRGRRRREQRGSQGPLHIQAHARRRAARVEPSAGPADPRHGHGATSHRAPSDPAGRAGRPVLHHGLPGPRGERHHGEAAVPPPRQAPHPD